MRLTPSTRIPKAPARRATSSPIAPSPTTSTVRPASTPIVGLTSGHARAALSGASSGSRLANASRPSSANSASGPAWIPLTLVTVDAAQDAGVELERGAELLPRAGVAGLDPAHARRRAQRLDQPRPGVAGDAEQHVGLREQLGPARLAGRVRVKPGSPLTSPVQREGGQHLRFVEEPDAVDRRAAAPAPAAGAWRS